MKANFDRSVTAVLKHEGGYVDHPKDPGGATNRGITIATLRSYRGRAVTKDDVKALTEAEAKAIYKKNYWDVIKADDLPAGVDHALFDVCVNSGPARAAQWRPLVNPADPKGSISAICATRLKFLKGLKTWDTFGKGWTTRVQRVEQEALHMASEATVSPAAPAIKPAPVAPAKPVAPAAAPPAPTPPQNPKSLWAAISGSFNRTPARD